MAAVVTLTLFHALIHSCHCSKCNRQDYPYYSSFYTSHILPALPETPKSPLLCALGLLRLARRGARGMGARSPLKLRVLPPPCFPCDRIVKLCARPEGRGAQGPRALEFWRKKWIHDVSTLEQNVCQINSWRG